MTPTHSPQPHGAVIHLAVACRDQNLINSAASYRGGFRGKQLRLRAKLNQGDQRCESEQKKDTHENLRTLKGKRFALKLSATRYLFVSRTTEAWGSAVFVIMQSCFA